MYLITPTASLCSCDETIVPLAWQHAVNTILGIHERAWKLRTLRYAFLPSSSCMLLERMDLSLWPQLRYGLIAFYVDHDGYNAQPYHNELIGYIIVHVLQKVSICSNNMHDELGKKA